MMRESKNLKSNCSDKIKSKKMIEICSKKKTQISKQKTMK